MPVQALTMVYLLEGERAQIRAAAAPSGLRRFKGLAYSGGQMRVAGFGLVVVDLAGLKVASDKLPALRQHDPGQIAGTVEAVKNSGRRLDVEGALSSATPSGAEIAATADEGFPWQMSIGVDVQEIRELAPGAKAVVNGQAFVGPLVIVARGLLKETSFVPLGADASTNVLVASGAAGGVVQATKPGTARARFDAAVAAAMGSGLARAAAVSQVVATNPSLQAELCEDATRAARRR